MNEDLTLKKQCELVHFQSSARSAKKSNDFFGFMWQFANKCRDIIIFEPVPRLNRVIEESIAYNHETKIKLMKKAVGDKVGVLTMLDNNNSNVVSSSTATGTVTVPVSTLDIELRASLKTPITLLFWRWERG